MTPTPMTEIGGTAAGAAVGAGFTGAPVCVAVAVALVSVAVAVALSNWLEASEGEMVWDELKPLPLLRTKAPRALLLESMNAAVGPAMILSVALT